MAYLRRIRAFFQTFWSGPIPKKSSDTLCPDTSLGSLPHKLTRLLGGNATGPPKLIRVYILVVVVTYLPLLFAHLSSAPSCNNYVSFFQDLGLGYLLLVSLPSLVVLLVSDDYVLFSAIDEVQRDGVINFSKSKADSFVEKWERHFRTGNLVAQITGILLGVVLGIITLRIFVENQVCSWIAPGGKLYLASYIYLYCIALAYAVIIFYVTRCVLISYFLRKLVKAAPLNILPLHPDKCGGLRPAGRLGLRNQYTLTILGINIVLLFVVWFLFMDETGSIIAVLIAAGIAYLILGPIIFMAPLLPFRSAMQSAKKEWMHEVAGVLRVEMRNLHQKLKRNEVDKSDEESIERLRKIGTVIDELPVWPFDPSTLRKFAVAYFVPAALTLLSEGLRAFLKTLNFPIN